MSIASAERLAALWTPPAVDAAWVAIAVNVFGLAALFVQLSFTRRALKSATLTADAAAAAARAAVSEARPWLKMAIGPKAQLIFGDSGGSLHFDVVYENIGRTPAVAVGLSIELVGPGNTNARYGAAFAKIITDAWAPTQTVFPGDSFKQGYGFEIPWEYQDGDEPYSLYALAVVRYRSHPLGEQYATPTIISVPGGFLRQADSAHSLQILRRSGVQIFDCFVHEDGGLHPT